MDIQLCTDVTSSFPAGCEYRHVCSSGVRVFVLLAYGRVCAGIEEALSVMFREVALTGDRALSRKHGNTEKNSDTHLQLWLRQRKNENPGQMWRKY